MSLKRAADVFKHYVSRADTFDKCLSNMIVKSADEKKVKMEFKVTDSMTNAGNNLHGGLTATIADVVSTLNLVTANKPPGVSVNLSVNYLKGAKVGDDIIVESEIVKAGRSVAYLDIKLFNKQSGDLVATGSHVKHLGS